MEGVVILGTVPAGESNQAEVGGNAMVVDGSPAEVLKPSEVNAENSAVVLTHASEFDEGLMFLDDPPAVALEQSQVSVEVLGKGVQRSVVVGVNCAPMEVPYQSEGNADAMILDSSPIDASRTTLADGKDHEKGDNKSTKRKRISIADIIGKDKEALTAEFRRELDDLLEYFKEVSGHKLHFEEGLSSSNNSMVAYLLEESNLPFSKLVEEIFDKLKGKEGVTLASVRSAVLFVGQRMMYGIPNADADVLEDESKSCLWCWETRDLKLLPVTLRGSLNIRRTARKKIHERISALLATLSALSIPESHNSYKSDLTKASAKLGKVLNREEIFSLVEKLKQKNVADMAEKEAKLKEKELLKDLEKNKRKAEKESRKMDRELQKEKLHSEREQRRMLEEAEKEEKRREKEEAELKKQLKRQREEAEREQRRREKEEAELKKQLVIQKQATIMERFLRSKKSKSDSDNHDSRSSRRNPTPDSSYKKEEALNSATISMDCAFSRQESIATEDLRRSVCWGVRHKPKTELFRELKLLRPSSEPESAKKIVTPTKELDSYKVNQGNETSFDKLVDELEECIVNQDGPGVAAASVHLLRKKLLQFDKSPRPAYYGTWRKKSGTVGPRHPFKKDPDLDYDVESDEEWEEEDPGESLSDVDMDDEGEHLEEENSKNGDEDESEDDFVVPDGYLSENEGVQSECSSDSKAEDMKNSSSSKSEVENEEFRSLLRQQKILHDMTEKALRKSQPLVISNLMHEKAEVMMAEDLSGAPKLEQICLQALCMRAFPGGVIVDMSIDQSLSIEDEEVCHTHSKTASSPAATTAAISESELREFVRLIKSCPYGMTKVVELLQQNFPSMSKSLLRNKVREIAEFVDNRWQVKKEILDRLGLSISPGKDGKPKGIAMYFSKRCLPPEGKSINITESSPKPCSKMTASDDDDDSPRDRADAQSSFSESLVN